MNKLLQQMQLTLVPILGRPLLEFAIAADASMQRLSVSSRVYSVGCRHLQSISGSCAKAEMGLSNDLNFETLLEKKKFFFILNCSSLPKTLMI